MDVIAIFSLLSQQHIYYLLQERSLRFKSSMINNNNILSVGFFDGSN